jgi:2-deoxy-D-gluconate 3-dehydrogenase
MSDFDQLIAQASTTLDRFRLGGKAAIVVGGGRGLGQAMALALAAAGADTCVVGRTCKDLEETAESIQKLGHRGEYIVADVTREVAVGRMVKQVHKLFGRIDILVNSQGTVHLQPSIDFEAKAWQKVIDVNLKSVFLCCKHVGRVMLGQGDMAYAPSKGAVNQLTRSLAIEWGPKGINVNGLAPVFTLTSINKEYLEDPVKRDWVLGRIPMKRVGQLEDLFGPVVFLASDASSFVNGHILVVDGGWLAA